MLKSLRRHIMMQAQGGKNIIGIGGDGVAQIVIPTDVTSVYFRDSGFRVEFYPNPAIFANSIPYQFNYNYLQIGLNGVTAYDAGYNYVRVFRKAYSDAPLMHYGILDNDKDYRKCFVEWPNYGFYYKDGTLGGYLTFANWMGTTPLGGNIELLPRHFISRIYMPNHFDLVAAEERGRLGFRDNLSGTFYGQTNSDGELVALYEE